MNRGERDFVRAQLDAVARARANERRAPNNPDRFWRLLYACYGDVEQARRVVRMIEQARP